MRRIRKLPLRKDFYCDMKKHRFLCVLCMTACALAACHAIDMVTRKEVDIPQKTELSVFLSHKLGENSVFYSADGSVWFGYTSDGWTGSEYARLTKCVAQPQIVAGQETINKFIDIKIGPVVYDDSYAILTFDMINYLPHALYVTIDEFPVLQVFLDGSWYNVINSSITYVGEGILQLQKDNGAFQAGVFLHQAQEGNVPTPSGRYRLFWRNGEYYAIQEFSLEYENTRYSVK